MQQPKDIDWVGGWKHMHFTLSLITSLFLTLQIVCNYFVLLVNHIPIMACNCNYLLFFVLLLIVKTDKHLSLLWKKARSLSHVPLFATLWTVAYQAPPSMGFSRQEYWSGLPFPSPGDLPDLGIKPGSPALEADALTSEPPGKPKHLLICVSLTADCECLQIQW